MDSQYRTVKQIIPAQRINMGGHLLDQPLPVQGIDQIDPFLLIHHWDHPLEGGQSQKDIGVGPHPHRGFSPVTFVFKGDLQHRDSLGNDAIVSEGGTQWMHAGLGITHSERPSQQMAEQGGENEFIQFWVNTPSKHKMETPYYLPLSDKDTPKIKDDLYTIAVVAGDFMGTKGPAKTYSPQTLLRVEAKEKAEISLDIPTNFNTVIYILNGELEVDGKTSKTKDMVWFNNDDGPINVSIKTETRFIVLSGEPIDEEVTSYGPFVMNTQSEVMEALRDAQMGKMGVLIEEF
ncbi:MAG: redox-sensitive bicupin YhaK (pirin superfamily) [Flavobacteriales bacterium]|jgi:redox-sensitive bicupin YhaK (pirin superfamily)